MCSSIVARRHGGSGRPDPDQGERELHDRRCARKQAGMGGCVVDRLCRIYARARCGGMAPAPCVRSWRAYVLHHVHIVRAPPYAGSWRAARLHREERADRLFAVCAYGGACVWPSTIDVRRHHQTLEDRTLHQRVCQASSCSSAARSVRGIGYRHARRDGHRRWMHVCRPLSAR